jgi:hypothetical protein
MYSMTMLEGELLGGAVLIATALVVLGALALFPRAVHTVPTAVSCPLLHCQVKAELVRDEWTLRFTDVVRCSVLGRHGIAMCNKGCLKSARQAARLCA